MRIGLNLLYLIPNIVGGTETYAAGLLHGLAQVDRRDEFIVFVNRESATWPLPDAPNFRRVICPIQATSRCHRYFYEQVQFPILLRQYGLDLLHSLGYITPAILPCKSIVSIHDIVYDYPGSFARKQVLRLLLAISAHSADHILTLSVNSQRQIASRLHVSPGKITVTYLAPKLRVAGGNCAWNSFRTRLGINDSYLLAFSSLSPSKNIPRLIQAFSRLAKDFPKNLQLVLVGHMPQRGTPLRIVTETLQLQERIIFTGYLSDAELALLLKHATVFVFPSLYEGFGIPVLEAMTAGVAVACSSAASLPEVAGNAALMFNPRETDEIVVAIRKLITEPNLRADLVQRGYQNVSRFSWQTTAEDTLQVYQSVGLGQNNYFGGDGVRLS